MPNIYINKEKCIRCGACINDCMTYTLERDEEDFPRIADTEESRCISCQHCFAICPTGAITFNGVFSDETTAPKFAAPEDVLNLIQSRKSIRQFTTEEISELDFTRIKAMLPYIPTGCNYNSLHFSFVESKSAMDEIRSYVNKKILKMVSNKYTAKYAGKFAKFKAAFENGEDIIFRNAPHMIVVSSKLSAPCANVDPIIALSYIELYAQSLGLGTCWCGFAQACFKILPKLSNMVEIPDGYKPVYVMLLGNPAVKYQRLTLPETFPIAEIKEIKNPDLNILQKIKRFLLNFLR